MGLTKKEKERLKELVKNNSLKEAVEILKIDYKEAREFLVKIWGEEKFKRRVGEKSKQCEIVEELGFNLKTLISKNLWVLMILCFLVFLVYSIALPNQFLSDDIAAIQQNPLINKKEYFWGQTFPLYFSPRNFLIFLTVKIFGLSPFFLRLENVFFHIGVSFLVFLILSLFFQPPIPLTSSAIYSVHPILIESVTWISGGPYANTSFFIFLSLLFWIGFGRTKKKKFLVFSFLSFLVALTFSERVVWLLAVIIIYELCFVKLKNNWKWLLPHTLLAVFWMIFLFQLARKRLAGLQTNYYQEPGFDNPLVKIPFAITSYLELIFWPQRLTFYHSELSMTTLEFIIRVLITLVFFGIILYFLKKEKKVFFWLSFFIVSLSPTLTPLRISWVVAERYVYTGTIGVIAAFVWSVFQIRAIRDKKNLQWWLFGLIVLSLSIRTIVRNLDWRNQDTLWLATAKYSPTSPQNHNNLGDLYARRGEYDKAIEEFKKAIELKPNYADAYHNLANIYKIVRKIDLAEENYLKALSFNPNLWQSFQNLSVIYFEKGQVEKAIDFANKGLAVNNSSPQLHFLLGFGYFQKGEKDLAKKEFLKVLELDPTNKNAKDFLSKI